MGGGGGGGGGGDPKNARDYKRILGVQMRYSIHRF